VTELWTSIRFLVIYPILATFGLAWAVMFFFRWRRYHCLGDGWAALLGLTIAIWAGGGLIATWVAGLTGYGATTSIIFTIGMFSTTGVLVVGVATLFKKAWKRD
jgi:hypothetical protein